MEMIVIGTGMFILAAGIWFLWKAERTAASGTAGIYAGKGQKRELPPGRD